MIIPRTTYSEMKPLTQTPHLTMTIPLRRVIHPRLMSMAYRTINGNGENGQALVGVIVTEPIRQAEYGGLTEDIQIRQEMKVSSLTGMGGFRENLAKE